jgi:hypothetical protein
LISSIILAAILFRPTRKFIFVQRVRKAERKLKRELTEEERKEIEKKQRNLFLCRGSGRLSGNLKGSLQRKKERR